MNIVAQPLATPLARPAPPAPYGMLAELTHRCPLQCPYCSNPVELDRRNVELDLDTWKRVFSEAAKLGVLQVHLSGGEPTARRDLEDMIRHCVEVGIYTNLITAGVGVTPERLQSISDAGIDHVQLSFQGATAEITDKVSNFRGAHERKLAVAREVRRLGLPLTINSVVHRANIHQIPAFIELALELDAKRIEIAHSQYYGWALRNRGALMPTREQVFWALDVVEEARARLKGKLDHRRGGARLLRQVPQALHEWLGPAVAQRDAFGQGAALPRGRDHPEPRLLERARAFAERCLAEFARLQRLPRHRLDARPLQELRAQGARLGRLPLPGDGDRRRCRRHRSGLPQVAAARPHAGAGRGGRGDRRGGI